MAMGHGDEVVELVTAGDEPSEPWWTRYQTSLQSGGISDPSVSVIRDDSSYIVDRCTFPADITIAAEGDRIRTGLVMGAVQSGKTASMLGVVATSLDAGVDVVIILAGTRIALWR